MTKTKHNNALDDALSDARGLVAALNQLGDHLLPDAPLFGLPRDS